MHLHSISPSLSFFIYINIIMRAASRFNMDLIARTSGETSVNYVYCVPGCEYNSAKIWQEIKTFLKLADRPTNRQTDR